MATMDMICSGVLQQGGFDVATSVTLSMSVGPDPHGVGDIRDVLAVQDDPAFARRYVGKRCVFVSAFDPDYKVEVFILGADGGCVAFPIQKRGAP